MFNLPNKNNKRKVINLLPKQFQEERLIKQTKKAMYAFSVIPILLVGVTYLSNNAKEDKLERAHSVKSEITSLNNDITIVENNVFNNTRIINGLMNEHIPLNYFLFDLSSISPADLVLFSVITENMDIEEQKKLITLSDGTEAAETPEESVVTDEDEYSDTGGEDVQEFDENGNPIEVEVMTEAEKQRLEELEVKSQKTIFIRGAVSNVDSLGIFIKRLEEKEYIDKVDMNKVENYFNSVNSYKIFELVVEIK